MFISSGTPSLHENNPAGYIEQIYCELNFSKIRLVYFSLSYILPEFFIIICD